MIAGVLFPMPPSGSVGYAHGGGGGGGGGQGAGFPSVVAYAGQGCGHEDAVPDAVSYAPHGGGGHAGRLGLAAPGGGADWVGEGEAG
jgi:hypothetical protein